MACMHSCMWLHVELFLSTRLVRMVVVVGGNHSRVYGTCTRGHTAQRDLPLGFDQRPVPLFLRRTARLQPVSANPLRVPARTQKILVFIWGIRSMIYSRQVPVDEFRGTGVSKSGRRNKAIMRIHRCWDLGGRQKRVGALRRGRVCLVFRLFVGVGGRRPMLTESLLLRFSRGREVLLCLSKRFHSR